MNRKTLTSAVIAGVAGVAGVSSISNAVNLNPDGLGQVLIYPYYTVNAGNVTLLSVVNTADEVKAVKVRFVESKNSRETLDFNLYLSPFDVWTGVVLDPEGDTTGPAAVATRDSTCTVPLLSAQNDGTLTDAEGNTLFYVNFKTIRFTELCSATAFCDTSPERSREGHFEMIEMGVVDETEDTEVTGLEAAAIHTGAGVPLNCNALVQAWIPGGIWNGNPNFPQGADTDIFQPRGGLFGGAAIISVAEGYEMSYNADAIDGFYADTGDLEDTLHADPGSELPTLEQAQTGNDTADVSAFVFDNGVVVTAAFSRLKDETGITVSGQTFGITGGRVDAVSAVYMHNEIYNEYATEAVVGGQTEWVVTQPTKRFYVNSAVPIRPYTTVFDGSDFTTGAACEPIGLTYTDREEGDPGVAPGSVNFSPFDPSSPVVPVLCYEAQIVSFNSAFTPSKNHTTIFGSPLQRNINTTTVTGGQYESGWATIDFITNTDNTTDAATGFGGATNALGEHVMIDTGTNAFVGLPVTGFSAQVVSNGTLTDANGNNVLSNYAGLYKHRADRLITTPGNTPAP